MNLLYVNRQTTCGVESTGALITFEVFGLLVGNENLQVVEVSLAVEAPRSLELLVEVAELLRELGDVRAVVLGVRLGAPDDDVEVEADVRGREPGGAVVARQADGVVARVVRGEREAAV